MCGLAGIVDTSGRGLSQTARDAAFAALARRGPDARHVWSQGACTLLHTRLRVIDTSTRADQPMEQGGPDSVVMVYNGELYNFRDLRSDLESLGVAFRTRSDAEVLLEGYRAWGIDVFQRARGMWAAAFWHPQQQRLVLARDPLGKKPLLYCASRERFSFASTMTALLGLLPSVPEVDLAAVNCYLAQLAVPFEQAVFKSVQKVPPGATVNWTPGGESIVERYWRIPERPGPSVEDSSAEVERLLRRAVRRRLESDVPLGVFLSAGYDSGLVAAIAAQESGRSLVAVTAGTTGSGFDERDPARLVATRYGLEHHCVEVPPVSAASLPALLGELGEPFGDPSILPSYDVARAARSEITVALTGDGGDEGFFGYSTFRGVRWAERYRQMTPAVLRRVLHRATRDVTRPAAARACAALFDYGVSSPADRYRNRMGLADFQREALIRPGWGGDVRAGEDAYRERFAALAGLPDADALRRIFFATYLPNDYLTKVDTATMAASLEARCPFLDLDLVEYALSLPAAVAFPGGRPKALLLPLARKLLPAEIVTRRKTGFAVPTGAWLRGPLRIAMEEFVFRPGTLLSTLIDTRRARELDRAHTKGADYSTQLWSLLALGVWGAVVAERRWNANDPLPVDVRVAA